MSVYGTFATFVGSAEMSGLPAKVEVGMDLSVINECRPQCTTSRAMIRMPQALEKARLKARMLMQVHDELIFEAPEGEVEKTMEIAKRIMQDAPEPAVKLSVPLIVDAAAAANWEEAH